MHNDILSIGPVTIHGYGLMIGLGLLFALLMAERRAKARGISADRIFDITLICALFGFLGAKLLYCIVEFGTLIRDPLSVLSGSGFVVYGGIIAGLISAVIYCRKKNISFLYYFDLLIPSVALAQGFGRIGCFLAGCCYGRETDSFIGLAFQDSELAPNGVKLIPTQLISSAGLFLLTALLVLYARRERQPGKVGALYLILYSVGRFVIEFFRDDYRGVVLGFLSTSQFISLFALAVGLFVFFGSKLFRRRQPEDSTLKS